MNNQQPAKGFTDNLDNMGILIIAMGGRHYWAEARSTIRSIRNFWPEARITVITERRESFGGDLVQHRDSPIGSDPGMIEVVQVEDLKGFKNQTAYVPWTPYEKTLHLDCDAVPIKRVAFQPFHLLDRFDFVAAHAAARNPKKSQGRGLPGAFTQWNCGVMFYNRNMIPVFQEWNRKQRGPWNPQGPLARLIWTHDQIRVYTLAPEWNYRGGLVHVMEPSMVVISHNHSTPPMIGADGKLKEDRFRNWFWSRTLRRLRLEGRT